MKTSDEALRRMEALVWRMAREHGIWKARYGHTSPDYAEAAEIAPMLHGVDPLILKMREIGAAMDDYPVARENWLGGLNDESNTAQGILAGLRYMEKEK